MNVDTLTLHWDNGGPMKGSTMLATLDRLGIAASFSRPRVSDDNPFSEALFRTLKYRTDFPDPAFKSLEDARAWVTAFVRWYNTVHHHSGIEYVTPVDRHEGRHIAILAQRSAVYEAAKAEHPHRWGSRPSRDWSPSKRVSVRARRTNEEAKSKKAARSHFEATTTLRNTASSSGSVRAEARVGPLGLVGGLTCVLDHRRGRGR